VGCAPAPMLARWTSRPQDDDDITPAHTRASSVAARALIPDASASTAEARSASARPASSETPRIHPKSFPIATARSHRRSAGRDRVVMGVLDVGGAAVCVAVAGRRYRCVECGCVMLVLPRELSPWRRYSLTTIALALAGFAAGETAGRVRARLAPGVTFEESGRRCNHRLISTELRINLTTLRDSTCNSPLGARREARSRQRARFLSPISRPRRGLLRPRRRPLRHHAARGEDLTRMLIEIDPRGSGLDDHRRRDTEDQIQRPSNNWSENDSEPVS